MLQQLLAGGATSASALAADSDMDGAREWLAWLLAGSPGAAPAVSALPGCLTSSRSAPGGAAALAASLLAR